MEPWAMAKTAEIKTEMTPIRLLRLLMDYTNEVDDFEVVVLTYRELESLRAAHEARKGLVLEPKNNVPVITNCKVL